MFLATLRTGWTTSAFASGREVVIAEAGYWHAGQMGSFSPATSSTDNANERSNPLNGV